MSWNISEVARRISTYLLERLLQRISEIVAERAVRNENATNIASNANTDNEETNDNEANNDLGNRNSEEGETRENAGRKENERKKEEKNGHSSRITITENEQNVTINSPPISAKEKDDKEDKDDKVLNTEKKTVEVEIEKKKKKKLTFTNSVILNDSEERKKIHSNDVEDGRKDEEEQPSNENNERKLSLKQFIYTFCVHFVAYGACILIVVATVVFGYFLHKR